MMSKKREIKKKQSKFILLKPVFWGRGTEQVSEQVDQVMYG